MDVDETEYYVNLPTIWTACDEFAHPSRVVWNTRLVKNAKLHELMALGAQVEECPEEKLMDLSQQLVRMFQTSAFARDQNYENVIETISMLTEAVNQMRLDRAFTSPHLAGVSFDPTRRYVADPATGLLQTCDFETVPLPDGRAVSYYSQLRDEAEVLAMRQHLDDTTHNRIQFMLREFTRTLLFEEDRVYDETLRYIALYLFFMCLAAHSRPASDSSSMLYIEFHYFSCLLDTLVRTRVIGRWQHDPKRNAMLRDMSKNYDSQHAMVRMCLTAGADNRAALIKRLLAEQSQFSSLAKKLNYARYTEIAEETVVEALGVKYFVFDQTFLERVVRMEVMDALTELVREKNLPSLFASG